MTLRSPRNDKDMEVVETVDPHGMSCGTHDFSQRRGPRIKGRWSYQKKWGNRYIRSKIDYLLTRGDAKSQITRCHLILPRCHESDHRAIVARLWRGSGRGKRPKRYRRRRQRFPVRLPRYGPQSESKTLVEELAETVVKPTPKKIPSNEWIRPSTWSLIDKKTSLSREGCLHQKVQRKLVREIKGSLKDDRRPRPYSEGVYRPSESPRYPAPVCLVPFGAGDLCALARPSCQSGTMLMVQSTRWLGFPWGSVWPPFWPTPQLASRIRFSVRTGAISQGTFDVVAGIS